MNTEKIVRPWGTYEVLLDENRYKVKRIVVDEMKRISYQSHENRSELWVITSGSGKVTIDDRVSIVGYNSIVSVPAAAKHRIENTSLERKLVFIEIQTGSSFLESDIKRFQDDFGRVEEDV